jgi:hypothetical protein
MEQSVIQSLLFFFWTGAYCFLPCGVHVYVAIIASYVPCMLPPNVSELITFILGTINYKYCVGKFRSEVTGKQRWTEGLHILNWKKMLCITKQHLQQASSSKRVIPFLKAETTKQRERGATPMVHEIFTWIHWALCKSGCFDKMTLP